MEKEREIKRKEGREKEDRIKMGLDTRRACWWSVVAKEKDEEERREERWFSSGWWRSG